MSARSWLVSVVHTAEALGGRGGVGEKRGHPELQKFKFEFSRTQGGRGGGRPGDASDVQKTALAKRSARVSIFRLHASCEQRGQLPARSIVATIAVCCLVDSDARHLLLQRTSMGPSTGPACVSLFTWFSSGRVFGVCGRRHALRGGRFPKMDLRVNGHGLREEEIDVVAMAVTAIVVNTMGGIALPKCRIAWPRVRQSSSCAPRCHLAFSHGGPRVGRTGGTWEDLRLCDDATDEYYRQKLRMSLAMFRQIVVACAAYVEKKVTHYRMPLQVEQVIAFALYRWASGETYESDTSSFGISRATGLQAVRDVTSALLQAYPDAIKWPVGRRRAQILRAFRNKGFPNCFGAIDCTHIYIDKPAGAPSNNYYDRKQKFSVQEQVVVDLDLRILDVHIGYPGSVHDVRVLHNSQLWRRAKAGELFDAPPENLPHGVVTRGYLLGDNGYPVACPWIVQPYGGIDQHPDEERFDTRQKVARGCVERAFG
ncbi:hypothetical protein CBR_g3909 [Chara braunii]|uniref:DDE Tnp4 domain-containing protein n=1 Tax=Chara braunii TaxID=69332 RepID=A0A388KGL9_CHABU|nr:hypothetical protein CBR_g3909 [Chara braunii]|eukprot:GBG69210.1 hypothetical protein CBR_g3909 [Chara braunii]